MNNVLGKLVVFRVLRVLCAGARVKSMRALLETSTASAVLTFGLLQLAWNTGQICYPDPGIS